MLNSVYTEVIVSYRNLPLAGIVLLRPDTVLSRTQNAFGIQRRLDPFVQSQLRMVVKAVRLGDLVHDSEMGPVLAPAPFRCVVDERLDQPTCSLSTVGVLAVEHDAHNVMHLAHADNKRADEVESGFLASPARDLILRHAVLTRNLSDRTEEEMRAVRQPVYPLQLRRRGNALQRLVPRL